MNKNIIIVMAGGLGKRMNSQIPKVLHMLQGEPMICTLLKSAYAISPCAILVVVGKYKAIIQSEIEKYLNRNILELIQYVDQPDALGTGNAVHCCVPYLNQLASPSDRVLILSGDTPLISSKTMLDMLSGTTGVAMITKYNHGDTQFVDYGKIILENDHISKIIEKKDCNETELLINCVNCGIYCWNFEVLSECTKLITNTNAQCEYYLTDLIEIAKKKGFLTFPFELAHNLQYEITGVNTQEQLKELEASIKSLKF